MKKLLLVSFCLISLNAMEPMDVDGQGQDREIVRTHLGRFTTDNSYVAFMVKIDDEDQAELLVCEYEKRLRLTPQEIWQRENAYRWDDELLVGDPTEFIQSIQVQYPQVSQGVQRIFDILIRNYAT